MKIIKNLLNLIGGVGILFVALSFTDLPYYAYEELSLKEKAPKSIVDYIVILGGDGMPSPSGLMRTYFGARAAIQYPSSTIIIALPYNEFDSLRQLDLMRKELKKKGISPSRVVFEPHGFNTYSQAREINKLITGPNAHLLIITSPEHMYRAYHTFEKQGFTKLSTLPTFEIPSDESGLKDKKKKEMKKDPNLDLRYNMWSYMQYEIRVIREYIAIAYYKLKGWL
jgi:uncharacterized SAM-binding protein YcdF (DUF218 family)